VQGVRKLHLLMLYVSRVSLHSNKIKTASKLATEYADVQVLPPILQSKQAGGVGPKRPQAAGAAGPSRGAAGAITNGVQGMKLIEGPGGSAVNGAAGSAPTSVPVNKELVAFRQQQGFDAQGGQAASRLSQALMKKKQERDEKPQYHAPCEQRKRGVEGHECLLILLNLSMNSPRETQDGHFWTSWLGAVGRGRAGKPVVRDWCWGPSDQG
jgi:hypothetical protein